MTSAASKPFISMSLAVGLRKAALCCVRTCSRHHRSVVGKTQW